MSEHRTAGYRRRYEHKLKSLAAAALITAIIIAGMVHSGSSTAFADGGITYYDDESEASLELRESMKARKEKIRIGISYAEDYEEVDAEGDAEGDAEANAEDNAEANEEGGEPVSEPDEETLRSSIRNLIELSLEHTGTSDEGDYLRFQYKDYKAKAGTTGENGRPAAVMDFTVEYFTDAAQERIVSSKAAEIAEELQLDGRSEYEKIKLIHDYICSSTEYDEEAAQASDTSAATDAAKTVSTTAYTAENSDLARSAYGALVNGRAVCQGYSLAFYRLLLEAGIDNRIIYGTASDGRSAAGTHTWNLVKLGGTYYYVDLTWDDNTVSRDWFLRGSAAFADTHFPDDDYTSASFTEKYPVSETDYHSNALLLRELSDTVKKPAACVAIIIIIAAILIFPLLLLRKRQ